MDYFDHVDLVKHLSWNYFLETQQGHNLVLMTTKSSQPYVDYSFNDNDILIAGRESAGVPENVHETSDARLAIPMSGGLRSLNIINASAMILGEALRQTNGF